MTATAHTDPVAARTPRAIPVRPRTAAVLVVASLAGLLMFGWPLLVKVRVEDQVVQPPFVFLLLLPVVILVCLAEFTEGGMDSKVLAMLGVLTAINAVMRGLSAGMAGIELVFFLLILGGRVFGAGFGFVLGCTSLFASALLTAGVGPWLPYQMLASAWVGMGAGLLPRRVTGKAEIAMLVAYGIFAAYAFGLLMNMSSWPFTLGIMVHGPHRRSLLRARGPDQREPAALLDLHAAHLDGQLGHRPRDHQHDRADRPRPGRPDHPAPRRTPGDRGGFVGVQVSPGGRGNLSRMGKASPISDRDCLPALTNSSF